MRKIVCVILIWLLVCLPVCASAQDFEDAAGVISTAAAVQFDVSAQDDSGIMPLAAVTDYSVSIASTCFEMSSEIMKWDLATALSLTGRIVSSGSVAATSANWRSFSGASPFYGFGLNFTNMSVSKGSHWTVFLNSMMLLERWQHLDGTAIQGIPFGALSPSLLSPRAAWVTISYSLSGHIENGSSWLGTTGTLILPVSLDISNVRYSDSVNPNRPYADYSFSVDFDLPDSYYIDGTKYVTTSGTVNSMKVFFAFPVRNNLIERSPNNFMSSDWDIATYRNDLQICFLYAGGAPCIQVLSGVTSSGSNSSGVAGLQQSIGSLSQNLTKQVSELKSTIQQGANEVKNEIKSQTQTITDKLTAVKDDIVGGITDLKETTTQGFKDVVQGITDLPGKIGEMLQGLIVPDSENVSGKFEDFNNLAEEKLGVIYQVPEMVISMGQSIVSGAVEQKGEMTLPKFEIIMPATNQSRAGERLTVWEEYTFPIWPEGTEVIHTAVQTATSLVCVIAMINSIKRKYEEWLDGH